MANLKTNDIADLKAWNKKELRKLRMTLNNRIREFESSSKPKELPQNHPLFEMDEEGCKSLLEKVIKAEKEL